MDSALQERGTEGVAKESLVHGRSTPAMRHIDFIFIPNRLPRRVREEVSVLKERFHPSLVPSLTSTSSETEIDLTSRKFRPVREIHYNAFSSALKLKRTCRNKNINLHLHDLYEISLNRYSENYGGK